MFADQIAFDPLSGLHGLARLEQVLKDARRTAKESAQDVRQEEHEKEKEFRKWQLVQMFRFCGASRGQQHNANGRCCAIVDGVDPL